MIHTKWNGIDKYNYSSHITYTGKYSGDEVEKDLKDCISQTLATAAESTQDWNWAMSHPCFCLQIPTALDGSKTNTVSPFSMSSLFLDLYAQMEQHFGKSMRKDEALKTESKMG